MPTQVVSVRFSKADTKALEDFAREHGKSVASIVREATLSHIGVKKSLQEVAVPVNPPPPLMTVDLRKAGPRGAEKLSYDTSQPVAAEEVAMVRGVTRCSCETPTGAIRCSTCGRPI